MNTQQETLYREIGERPGTYVKIDTPEFETAVSLLREGLVSLLPSETGAGVYAYHPKAVFA